MGSGISKANTLSGALVDAPELSAARRRARVLFLTVLLTRHPTAMNSLLGQAPKIAFRKRGYHRRLEKWATSLHLFTPPGRLGLSELWLFVFATTACRYALDLKPNVPSASDLV